MLCSRVRNLISAYCDSELSGLEMREIRSHMERCPECRSEFEAARAVKRLLGSLRPPEPREPFSLEAIEARASLRRTRVAWPVALLRRGRDHAARVSWRRALGYGAVACSVAAAGLALGIISSPRPQDSITVLVPETIGSDGTLVGAGSVRFSPPAPFPLATPVNWGVPIPRTGAWPPPFADPAYPSAPEPVRQTRDRRRP